MSNTVFTAKAREIAARNGYSDRWVTLWVERAELNARLDAHGDGAGEFTDRKSYRLAVARSTKLAHQLTEEVLKSQR